MRRGLQFSKVLCAVAGLGLASCGGLFPGGQDGGSGGGSGGSGGGTGGSGGSGGGSGGSGGGAGGCNASNPEPDVCGYGGYCDGFDNTCGVVVFPPPCGNFTNAVAAQAWKPDAGTGPVIWTFAEETDDVAFCCESRFAHTARLYVYKPGTAWPTPLGAVPGFRYYNTAGTFIDATGVVRPSNYTPSGQEAQFKTTLCATSASAFTAGFIFDNGNGFCAPSTGGTQGTAKLPDGGSC